MELELGSGDGSFLAQYADAHRDRNFFGVERLLGRLRKLERKSNRLGLTNVRVVPDRGRLLPGLFAAAQPGPEALHIYFPDPWPKRKHRKNRLINQRFTQLARTALHPGGKVYLRTDDADYFAQMKSVFGACPFFQEVPTPARHRWFPSRLRARLLAARRPNPASGLATNRHAAADVRSGLAANWPGMGPPCNLGGYRHSDHYPQTFTNLD